MDGKNKRILLRFLGIYFIILGAAAIISSIFHQTPYQILYACYVGVILIGIGILTKKSFIILSQVYILAIPLLVWDIDFFHWIIFNHPLFGITDYFFIDFSSILDKFISLQHLYTIPVAIYAIKLIGVKRKDAWKWSAIQIIVMFFVVLIFSPSVLNINCVFNSCININFGIPYIFVWFLANFIMVILTVFILNHFLWHRKKRGIKTN